VCVISGWGVAYRILLKDLLYTDTWCELGKDVATVICVCLLNCGAGMTWWLDTCGLTVHVVNHSSVGSVVKVNGGGTLRDVEQFYNHRSAILKLKNFPRHISVTKNKTRLQFSAKNLVIYLCFTISPWRKPVNQISVSPVARYRWTKTRTCLWR